LATKIKAAAADKDRRRKLLKWFFMDKGLAKPAEQLSD
jgi:hypothetical protein